MIFYRGLLHRLLKWLAWQYRLRYWREPFVPDPYDPKIHRNLAFCPRCASGDVEQASDDEGHARCHQCKLIFQVTDWCGTFC